MLPSDGVVISVTHAVLLEVTQYLALKDIFPLIQVSTCV
jgi:hypothetical protein